MVYESERRATRRDGLRETMSSSLSKSTTCEMLAPSMLQEQEHHALTIFPFWLNLDKNLVLAHNFDYLANIRAGLLQQL
jgi:hypothetical protein